MSRFIQETDYSMQVKGEIIRLLTEQSDTWYNSTKLVRAEQTAQKQFRHWIGKLYDIDAVLNANVDDRDEFIVTCIIDLALYHLCSQTGMKDIPEHRQQRYQDVLDWLKSVADGTVTADIPLLTNDNGEMTGGVIWFESRKSIDHKW